MNYLNNILFFFALCLLINYGYAGEHENDYSVFSRTVNIEEPSQQNVLRNQSTWKEFQKRNGHWYVSFNTINELPLRAAGTPIAVDIEGTTEEKAMYFLTTELKGFNLPLEGLKYQQINETKKHYYVRFIQEYEGLSLWNASLQVVMTKGFEVIGFTMDVYDVEELDTEPSIKGDLINDFMASGVKGTVEKVSVDGLKVLPIPAENGYQFRLVYEGMVDLKNSEGHAERLYTMMDASNGTIYYRQNKIRYYEPVAQGEWTMLGYATENANDTEKLTFLPNMRVDIDMGTDIETHVTDENGRLNVEITEPTMATVYMRGDYCTVYEGSSRNNSNIPSYEVELSNDMQEVILPEEADLVAVSAYKSVNRVHDWMKFWLPEDMTQLDYSLPTHIDLTDGTCNAFADGSSINFFREGGGCWTLALMADVIYHEYGHNINGAFYDYLGANFINGGLHEGYADVWGLSITQEPILSEGYLIGSGGSFIRRYDTDPKVYPDDLTGAVHDNGEIIAGAWWDLGQVIGNDAMFEIFVNSHYGTPMRAEGEEGVLFSDVLFQALIADDDNGDLSDGTPNSDVIIEAFALHGIKLQLSADIVHENIPLSNSNDVIAIDFEVNIDFNYQSFVKDIVVKHREQGQGEYLQALAYDFDEDNNYTTWIVSPSKGVIFDYYIEVQSNIDALPVIVPEGVTASEFPNLPYQILVGYEEKVVDDFSDFESETAWTIGDLSDDASTGIWEIGTPNPTFTGAGEEVQMSTDRTPTNSDNRCAFTGNTGNGGGIGENDVDDGKTTLFSPVYNIKGFISPAISYHRWYVNNAGANPGNDFWEVYVSGDGGDWIQVENGNITDATWRLSALRLKDYVESAESTVQLQFVASDPLILDAGLQFDGGSLVEAGVDDVIVYDIASEIVGIDDFEVVNNLVKIFPNPVSDVLNIVNTNLGEGKAQIALFDIAGKEVYTAKDIQLVDHQLDTSKFSKGIYLIRVTFDNQIQQQKIIIR
ncbi:MAG: T9SS type A sorting domain-containing protein [Chitinophagales bacterium]